MKFLAWTLLAAAGCWILSELLEIAAGGRTAITFVLTAAFHLLAALGMWGAYAGLRTGRNTLALVATGAASLGYLVLIYPPIASALGPPGTFEELMRPGSIFGIPAMLATLGVSLFGAVVLYRKSYARWIGVALLICPPVFATMVRTQGPVVIAFAANVAHGLALAAIGAHLRVDPRTVWVRAQQ
jgi:hypothetical protein